MQLLTSALNFRRGGESADPLTRPYRALLSLHLKYAGASVEGS